MATRPATYDTKTLAEYARTHTWQQTAAKFGCSRSTVENACSQHGVQSPNKTQMTRKRIADWVRENNATISDAMREFGCSRHRAAVACNENGVQPSVADRLENVPVALSNFEVLRFLIEGYSGAKIAEEMFVSRQRIDQIRARAEQAGLFGPDAVIQLKPNHGVNNALDDKAEATPPA